MFKISPELDKCQSTIVTFIWPQKSQILPHLMSGDGGLYTVDKRYINNTVIKDVIYSFNRDVTLMVIGQQKNTILF